MPIELKKIIKTVTKDIYVLNVLNVLIPALHQLHLEKIMRKKYNVLNVTQYLL